MARCEAAAKLKFLRLAARAVLAHVAQRSIDTQYYMIHNDVVGSRFVDQLYKAAERDVRVRILANSLSATDVSLVHAGYARYRKELLRMGVELYELNNNLSREERDEAEKGSLDLNITGPLPPTLPGRNLSRSTEILDGVIGVRGHVALIGNLYLPYHLDIGAGGSQFSWQAAAGLGYRFHWGSILLDYRHISFDQDDDELIDTFSLSGPALGIVFSF